MDTVTQQYTLTITRAKYRRPDPHSRTVSHTHGHTPTCVFTLSYAGSLSHWHTYTA